MKIFSTASMFSKKELKVQDILQFAWETDTQAPTDTELQRLKTTAEKLINANGTGL